jgi:hypothetical protein
MYPAAASLCNMARYGVQGPGYCRTAGDIQNAERFHIESELHYLEKVTRNKQRASIAYH